MSLHFNPFILLHDLNFRSMGRNFIDSQTMSYMAENMSVVDHEHRHFHDLIGTCVGLDLLENIFLRFHHVCVLLDEAVEQRLTVPIPLLKISTSKAFVKELNEEASYSVKRIFDISNHLSNMLASSLFSKDEFQCKGNILNYYETPGSCAIPIINVSNNTAHEKSAYLFPLGVFSLLENSAMNTQLASISNLHGNDVANHFKEQFSSKLSLEYSWPYFLVYDFFGLASWKFKDPWEDSMIFQPIIDFALMGEHIVSRDINISHPGVRLGNFFDFVKSNDIAKPKSSLEVINIIDNYCKNSGIYSEKEAVKSRFNHIVERIEMFDDANGLHEEIYLEFLLTAKHMFQIRNNHNDIFKKTSEYVNSDENKVISLPEPPYILLPGREGEGNYLKISEKYNKKDIWAPWFVVGNLLSSILAEDQLACPFKKYSIQCSLASDNCGSHLNFNSGCLYEFAISYLKLDRIEFKAFRH